MERWFVTIDHLSDGELGFFGYTLVRENERFKIYRHYTGDEHVVSKTGVRFLYVEDINDAIAINAARTMRVTDED